MIADNPPFERIVRSEGTDRTGETRYVTECGHVFIGKAWERYVSNGYSHGRIVNNYFIPEPQSVKIEAPVKRPVREPELNRHERRKQAKLQRSKR